MGTPAQNVAALQHAYRQWHETRGKSVEVWLELVADDVVVRSLADGQHGVAFTAAASSKDGFRRYFAGLLADWEMNHYTTDQFIAEGDRVAMLGSTGWRNRQTGREFDTPKADFWTFRDGKAVTFTELYDTAAVRAAALP
jgi:uncharacterized protein